MGTRVTKFRLASGTEILAEVEDNDADKFGRVAAKASLGTGAIDVDAELGKIQGIADTFLERLKSLAQKPSECELTFGVKLSAEAGVIIAKTSGEANFEIKLKWAREAT